MSKFENGYQLHGARFRDQIYRAAVNTTNGVESQNKFSQSYLPRKKNITISRLATRDTYTLPVRS